jgi:hypothetical protein
MRRFIADDGSLAAANPPYLLSLSMARWRNSKETNHQYIYHHHHWMPRLAAARPAAGQKRPKLRKRTHRLLTTCNSTCLSNNIIPPIGRIPRRYALQKPHYPPGPFFRLPMPVSMLSFIERSHQQVTASV